MKKKKHSQESKSDGPAQGCKRLQAKSQIKTFPLYPFRSGIKYIWEPVYWIACDFSDGSPDLLRLMREGQHDPLSEEEVGLIVRLVGSDKLIDLRAFLEQKCHQADVLDLKWDRIFSHLRCYERNAAKPEAGQGGSAAQTDKGRHTKYSRPLSMKDWAYIFDVGRNKMREFRDSEQYHFLQKSPRKWVLPIGELPAEYLEKYRSATSR